MAAGRQGITSNFVPEDIDPFDIFGWDLPGPNHRHPKVGDSDYLTAQVMQRRYRVIAKIMSQAEREHSKPAPMSNTRFNPFIADWKAKELEKGLEKAALNTKEKKLEETRCRRDND